MGETRGSYNKRTLVVSQTEPANPTDGLLWYRPDLCETTTTTTRVPCDYEGVMTVGTNGISSYGYQLESFGSINPTDSNVILITWNGDIELAISECYDEVTLYLDDVPYVLLPDGENEGLFYYVLSDIANPFPSVGETCQIGLCYGTPCTTTTTEEPETITTTTPIQG